MTTAKSCCRRIPKSAFTARRDKSALGAIILVDGASPKAAKELPYYVDYFHNHHMNSIVVGITHCDIDGAHLSLNDANKLLETRDLKFPIYEIDARKRDDVLLLVEALIASIEAELN